ncbi:hypothetical protein [Neptunomonas phycophila]|uniref:hypothetical protein n=1 Tax=Neptunomonas phycophila TaxID=1572645 RepID=UPI000948A922|nr:hypothetical protein [Neptunomonas phycophila]
MEFNMTMLPLASSICLIIALVEAWFMTMVRYLKWNSIKRLFPGYRYLVLSHIDYLMMASLVYSVYLVLIEFNIALHQGVVWLIFIGALYNPFDFLLQAIKPDIADGESALSKIGVVIGFLPLTVGLGWTAITLLITILNL